MNHYHFSYCLDIRAGGVNLNYEKVKVSELIRFFTEDSTRPVAHFNLDGGLVQVNEPFRNRFQANHMTNIKQLFGETMVAIWAQFIGIVKRSKHITLYMPIRSSAMPNIIEIRFMYCEFPAQVIALFNLSLNDEKEVKRPYSKAFFKSDNLMVIVDHNEIICDINEVGLNLFNLSRNVCIGKTAKELFHMIPIVYEDYKSHLKMAFMEGYDDIYRSFEKSVGDVRNCRITTFYDEETRMYLTRVSDQTEMILLEERLSHKDTLSSVGQLAASIAHEIRNPMTALKGFTQLLRVSASEESKRYLSVIDDEIVRMESILSDMLILSKPSTNEKETISLYGLISSMIRVIQPKANLDGITIVEKEITLSDDSIFGDAGKLRQVFLNLLKNALESMPWGGVLTIGIEKSREGDFTLSISDTGKGLGVDQLKHIFTPYFTTKVGGTGLGLPFALKTIEAHGGMIAVESEIDVGTTFMISFPPALTNVHGDIVDERVLTESGWHY